MKKQLDEKNNDSGDDDGPKVDLAEERIKELDDLKKYVGEHRGGVKEYLGIKEDDKGEEEDSELSD